MLLVLYYVVSLAASYRKSRTRLTPEEIVQFDTEATKISFNQITNLPNVHYDSSVPPPPTGGVVDCHRRPLRINPAQQGQCPSLCGSEAAVPITIGEGQVVVDASGNVMQPGMYCVVGAVGSQNCNLMYASLVFTSDKWACLPNMGNVMGGPYASIPLYTTYNGSSVPGVVLRNKAGDVVDPLKEFIDFHNPDVISQLHVDVSAANIEGYKLTTLGGFGPLLIDPCANIPFTDAYYDHEKRECICPGDMHHQDSSNLASRCVGASIPEPTYDKDTRTFTLPVPCLHIDDPGVLFKPTQYLCRENNISRFGETKMYLLDDDLNQGRVDPALATLDKPIWNWVYNHKKWNTQAQEDGVKTYLYPELV